MTTSNTEELFARMHRMAMANLKPYDGVKLGELSLFIAGKNVGKSVAFNWVNKDTRGSKRRKHNAPSKN